MRVIWALENLLLNFTALYRFSHSFLHPLEPPTTLRSLPAYIGMYIGISACIYRYIDR